jgi:rare lipoprotein A
MLNSNPITRIEWLRLSALAVVLLFAGCVTHRPQQPLPPLPPPPPDISKIPEPVPRAEPRSAQGNPPFYEALGKRYFVMANANGYVERGVASWYGPGFHAANTSNGEKYDMYGMTAAHKTLPLPTYVQVTNLQNGRSVIVRVNDRGPFKEGRIIDLSRTAAERLDIVRAGTGFVEVRAITPGAEAAPAPAPKTSELYVQAGAFSSEGNANRLRDQLRSQGEQNSFVRKDTVGDRVLYRVRIGPVPNVSEFDEIVARLRKLGFPDARLAND